MKKNITSYLCILLLALASVAGPANYAAANGFSATIKAIEGDVTVKMDDKSEWIKASVGQVMNENSYLMTAFESDCDIEFVDKSVMKIKELSKIQINKFSNELKKVDAQVTLYNGSVRAKVHKDVDKNTQFQVKTPVSTIAVRGTEKEITTQPGFGTQVNTISGIVEVSNNLGQKVTVTQNQQTSVAADGSKPVTIVEGIKEQVLADIKSESMTKEEIVTVKEFTKPIVVPITAVKEQIDVENTIKKVQTMGNLTITWK